MKKVTLLLCLFAWAWTAGAQDCVVDSSVIQTGALLSPAPYSDQAPDYNLAEACIGEPYNQSITVNVPTTFSGFPIDSVGIATTGAIGNYPTGMTYLCEPPTCTFYPGSLGCILLYGTPAASVTPGTFDLTITATVFTQLIDLPVSFPGQTAPGSHYYLIVNETGECASAASDPNSPVASLKNTPNPFAAQTWIEVESRADGLFQFEVFDLLGQRVYAENVRLVQGANRFTFDAGDLAAGSYFYAIGNREGRTTKMLVVSR